MILKKAYLSIFLLFALSAIAQQDTPTSGDVTVQLSEPISFASARPLQAVRSVVVSSTNPAIAPGGMAVLQVQNRDGSYTLKLLRIASGGQAFKTMSQPGRSPNGMPASGLNTSLAAGATLRFTLTQQDGSAGVPVAQSTSPSATAARVASTPNAAGTTSTGTSEDRAHFEIEGVRLGQTVADLLAAEKAYSPKVTKQQGTTSCSFKTADLEFTVMFSKAGVLNRMDIYSVTKTKGSDALSDLKKAAVSSAMYKQAVRVYGTPDNLSAGDEATWKSSFGSATYVLDGDSVEVLAAGV